MDTSLFEKYRNNTLTKEELQQFIELVRNADDAALDALMAADMDNFDPEISADDDVKATLLTDITKKLHRQKRNHRLYKICTMAAAILVPIFIFGNIYLFINWKRDSQVATKVHTMQGQLATVQLPDESAVTINSESSLRYTVADFSQNKRKVDFEGEAFFNISKLDGKPFIIRTREIELTVYGTSFNLKAYNDQDCATVSLISGSVAIKSKRTGEEIYLEPNQAATVDYTSGAFSIEEIDVNKNITAWRDGVMSFSDATMTQVIGLIEENYKCRLVPASKISNVPFTGAIPMNNINAAIDILRQIYSTTFTVEY